MRRLKAFLVFHKPTTFGHPLPGKVRYRRTQRCAMLDVTGRKVVPGSKIMYGGLPALVLGVGYEHGEPVVHLASQAYQ